MSEEPKEVEVQDLTARVVEFLKEMKTREEDFVPEKKGKMPPIHDGILQALKEEFEPGRFIDKAIYGEYDIDYVKRNEHDSVYGRIELAVEVDRWRNARRSWLKLLDIRANHNVWVFIGDRVEDFRWSVDKIRELIKIRHEDKTTVGRFLAVMKRPKTFKVEKIV